MTVICSHAANCSYDDCPHIDPHGRYSDCREGECSRYVIYRGRESKPPCIPVVMCRVCGVVPATTTGDLCESCLVAGAMKRS